DNPFSQKAQRGGLEAMGEALVAQARLELSALRRLFELDAARWLAAAESTAPDASWPAWDGLRPLIDASVAGDGPAWRLKQHLAQSTDWAALVPALATHYATTGSGLFARYRAFRWSGAADGGSLVGIDRPDTPRLDELVGYEAERELLLLNTEH